MLRRRQLLRVAGLGAAVAGLTAACGSDTGTDTGAGGTPASSAATASTGEIPDETAGPYPGDGSNGPNVLTDSGVVRGDIRSSFGTATGTAQGVPMTLELTIVDLARNAPFAGAAVYVWHCDREGRYSLYSDGVTDQNYLRGVQLADAQGKVTFTSVFPACYAGRWPHVHFEVYPDRTSITDATKAVATSQVALPKDACDTVYATTGYAASVRNLAQVTLSGDNVFGNDGGTLQLGTTTGDATRGYTVALTAKVDTRTTPTAGGAGPGGPGGPGGAPPSGMPPRR
ncbi:intradiol ring-cleavage dioxygenase [Dactylosporangium aurantiacum]|uniref:Intradiol ring-cleavage dioxygenase n=2 Tax=Dactylosporangium aurantiacum TaxID=35754 RepID=A0A9Q9MNQ7_9ACTN|nr:intradiol ring-cleavage dioxygenase [Dactylosporangium aurantiacum]